MTKVSVTSGRGNQVRQWTEEVEEPSTGLYPAAGAALYGTIGTAVGGPVGGIIGGLLELWAGSVAKKDATEEYHQKLRGG